MDAISTLGHQGGWDEILIIIGPLILIVWVVGLVRYRMRREATPDADADTNTDTDTVAS